jgi:pyruvate,water dikinase
MWSRIRHLLSSLFTRDATDVDLRLVFEQFQALLQNHQRAMDLIADLGEKSGGDYVFDRKYPADIVRELQDLCLRMVKGLNLIASHRYPQLYTALDRVFIPIEAELAGRLPLSDAPYVISLRDAPLDTPELTGGKANTLLEIIHRLGIPVPDGFVITNRAYHRFLEYNGLRDRIHSWIEAWVSGKEDLGKAAGKIRYSILAGIVPHDLANEIMKRARKSAHRWAVRSSAYGEDGELSFAGMHETRLNVPSEQVPEAYKTVVASLYSPEALTYRRRMGMIGEEAAMSVLCQEMVRAAAGGIVQTVCIERFQPDCLAIYSSVGLGRTVVEGRGPLDRYLIEKEYPHAVKSEYIAKKETAVLLAAGGGEEEAAIPEGEQSLPSVSPETVKTLGTWAVTVERYFKCPQEIEWAVDTAGRCWLLQSRPLVFPDSLTEFEGDISEACSRYPVLIGDRGLVAHAGVGTGPVYIVHTNEEMANFPEGGILVTQYSAPWLAQIVPKASGIITERGSPAGHLATIARELRVPALVGVDGATRLLRNGTEVTVDSYHRIVYAGRVRELLRHELLQSTVFEESPEFRILRRLRKRIAALHLADPQSSDFTPEGCTSVHDIIRFIHEKAVQELMDFPTFLNRFKGVKIWTLISDVPLGLRILDLGGGIEHKATGDTVRIEEIRSLPLRALWTGVSDPNTWSTEPVPIDFRGLMSSLTRTWDDSGGGHTTGGFNLAVIDKSYMNLHLRLGYHLNLIDARMDDEPQHNHIYFRFVGGVTDITRRSRRAQVLFRILSHYHFNSTVKGDLVLARLLHLSREEIELRLKVLGALIGFTRQLDIQLRSDGDVDHFVERFFSRHAPFAPSLT